MNATRSDYIDIVERLLEYPGIDVNIKDIFLTNYLLCLMFFIFFM